jgi:LemA protein
MKNPVVLIILAIVVILGFWGCSGYNNLATAQAGINGKWGEVETQYQRKKNLYDNVVATVKGAARNEDTTLIKITKMRSKIPDNIDQNNPQALADANRQFDQLRSAINISVEAYPTLQSTQAYRDFQVQIEGTENRVAVAIRDWNDAITDYNSQVVRFPNNLLAGFFGYKVKENYKSDDDAKDTKVDFGS